MSEVAYHRQIHGGPVIVVKNGFLDERCGPEEEEINGPRVQRSKSAPQRLSDASEVAEILTDADSNYSYRDRGLSGDASTSLAGSEIPRSPFVGYEASGPSSLLQSALRHTPKRNAEETVDGLSDFKLEDAAAATVHFDLIGLDEPEGNVSRNWSTEEVDQKVSPFNQTAQVKPAAAPAPVSPVLQPLNAQLLQQLLAAQAQAQVMQVSAQHFWQLQMQPSMQPSRPSSVQPSLHSSPQISPQLAPQLGAHVPQLLLSPLMSPQGPEPSLLSPESSRPQSPQPSNPCPVGLQAPQPHTIRHSLNMETGMHQVFWHVDASKLKGQERQTVSPSFELPFEGQVSFRLVLVPKPNPDGKGGASFKKANGVGSVHLKCEAAKGLVNFFVSISNGRPDFNREPRGPVKHNFAELSTCGLRKAEDMWDFTKAVDKETQTFAVCLEISSLA